MDALDYGPVNDPSYYYDSSAGGGSSIDWNSWGSGIGNTLGSLTDIYAKTWSQTQLMQQAQNGQRYIEGQRLQYTNQAVGGISPLLLILGAGLIFVFATRGN